MKNSLLRNKLGIRFISVATAMMLTAGALTGCGMTSENNNTQVSDEVASVTEDEDSNSLQSVMEQQAGLSHTTSGNPAKEEVVYVLADANGNTNKIIVSDWLKNTNGEKTIADTSALSDISNVSGDESFTQDDEGNITWDAEGNDIHYQGTSTAELPVSVNITYKLDGNDITPEELAGKSGKVTVRFDYTNNEKKTVEIGGKEKEIFVPFTMMSGAILDNEHFNNIEVTNGRVISTGSENIVVGMAFPGLADSLRIDELKEKLEDNVDADTLDETQIPDYVEITADTVNFQMNQTMTMAMSDVLSSINLDKDLSIDTSNVTDSMDELSDASVQLADGTSDLNDGAGKLADGAKTLSEKSVELDDGAKKLSDGANQLNNGAAELRDGAGKLKDGAYTLKNGASDLDNGAGTLKDGIDKVDSGAADLKAGIDSLDQGAGSLKDGIDQVSKGATALSTGADTLNAGASRLATGAGNLATGAATLAEKTANLPAQTKQLADGAKDVSDGITALQSGIAENARSIQAMVLSANGVLNDAGASSTEKALAQYVIAMAGSLNTISTNIDTIGAGATQVSGGMAQLDAGSTELKNGAAALSAGAAEVKTGADQVAAGVGSIKEGANSLKEGTGKVASGASTLKEGTGKLSAGAGTLKDGTKQLSDGAGSLKEGTSKLLDGAGTLADGTSTLYDGTATLQDGTLTLYNGTTDLCDGTSQFVDGTKELYDGTLTLNDGTRELMEGMFKFKDEGIDKLTELFGTDVDDVVDTLKAVMDAGSEYSSFSGANSDVESTVKFIYKTDAVK